MLNSFSSVRVLLLSWSFAWLIPLCLHASNEISLAEAMGKALAGNPALETFDSEVRIAEGKIISALAKPNPELEGEIEDVFGSGELRGTRSAVYNLGVSQLIELGGKRALRGNIAKAGVEVEKLRYQAARRVVIQETAQRFVDALSARESVRNAQTVVAIASETVDSVTALQEGGRGSAIDVQRSELGLKQARLQLENYKRQAKLARQQLAAMWGGQTPGFDRVSGSMGRPDGLPSKAKLQAALAHHPNLALAKAGVTTAEHELMLQERLVIPDMNLGIAFRHEAALDDNAIVMSFSIPLPFRNRNEGGIAEAKGELERTEALVSQAKSQLDLRFAEAWIRLAAAHDEFQLVSNQMLPAAEELHQTLADGFRLGRTSYLELLEARRALAALQQERVDALSKFHAARMEIETLTGSP